MDTYSNRLVDLKHPIKSKLMLTLLLSLFVTSISQTVISISGPSIVANLGGFKYYSWVFAAFSLTSAIVVPIVGKLNDRHGPKKIIVPSLLLFSLATFICGLSTNIFMLIFARAIQGIGFAGVMGTIWIVIALLWRPSERGKWLGITSAGFTTAGVIGPIIGGIINDFIGWRWIFFTNIPLCLIATIIIMVQFPPQDKLDKSKFDLKGTTVFGLFASTFLFAISVGGHQNSYYSIYVLVLLLISIFAIMFL